MRPEEAINHSFAIPETHAKELVSLAYLQAIIAQAGLNTNSWKWDDGIDLQVGSNKEIAGVSFPSVTIPLQVKATAAWEVKDHHIAYSLKAAAYNRLRRTTAIPQYLVLYTLPEKRDGWVTYDTDHCRLFNIAHYVDLAGGPAIGLNARGEQAETITVHVPTANRLTATSLLGLFEQACQKLRALEGNHA